MCDVQWVFLVLFLMSQPWSVDWFKMRWTSKCEAAYLYPAQLVLHWLFPFLRNCAQWEMCSIVFLKETKRALLSFAKTCHHWITAPHYWKFNLLRKRLCFLVPKLYNIPMESRISTAWMRFSSVSKSLTLTVLPANICLTAIEHSPDQLPPTGTTPAIRHSIA